MLFYGAQGMSMRVSSASHLYVLLSMAGKDTFSKLLCLNEAAVFFVFS